MDIDIRNSHDGNLDIGHFLWYDEFIKYIGKKCKTKIKISLQFKYKNDLPCLWLNEVRFQPNYHILNNIYHPWLQEVQSIPPEAMLSKLSMMLEICIRLTMCCNIITEYRRQIYSLISPTSDLHFTSSKCNSLYCIRSNACNKHETKWLIEMEKK